MDPNANCVTLSFGRWGGAITGIAVFLAVLSFAWIAFHPMYDADLWWHLKTGEWIVEHGQLPDSDPFAFTSDASPTTRARAILKGYPASQLLYHLIQSSFGFPGLLALRIFVLLGLMAILVWAARKQKAQVWLIAVCLAAGWATFFWAHTADRPHLFSFLFFAMLVSQFRPVGRENWWMLPIMAVWANFHGGYIVGCLIIAVYIAGRFLDLRWGKEFQRSLLWGMGCVVVSFLNPNGAYSLIEVLTGSLAGSSAAGISEYASTFKAYANGEQWVWVLWGQIVLVLLARVVARRVVWAEILPMLVLAVLSLLYIRMVAFFSLCLIPWFAADLTISVLRWRALSRLVAAVCLVVVVSIPVYANGRDVSTGWWVFWPEQNAFYPAEAMGFLESVNLRGRMFNFYTWGGYMIWRLYPQYQVFIDGRAFDDQLFADYQAIEHGDLFPPDRHYEGLLDRYRVNYVVIPIQNTDGSLFPLFARLYGNSRWVPVYADMRTAVFIRDNDEMNREVLASQGMATQELFNLTLNRFRLRVVTNRGDLAAWQGAVELYITARRMQEARDVLAQALQVSPGNPGFVRLAPLVGLGSRH